MQCNKCDSTIKKGLDYCAKCKTKLVLSEVSQLSGLEPRYCENCGNLMDDGDFCSQCGFASKSYKKKVIKKNNKKYVRTSRKRRVVAVFIVICILLSMGLGIFMSTIKNKKIFNEESAKREIFDLVGSVVVDSSIITKKATDEETAYGVLDDVSHIFGYENAKESLSADSVKLINGDTYYRFSQKGESSRGVVVAADKDGKIFHISGNYKVPEDKRSENQNVVAQSEDKQKLSSDEAGLSDEKRNITVVSGDSRKKEDAERVLENVQMAFDFFESELKHKSTDGNGENKIIVQMDAEVDNAETSTYSDGEENKTLIRFDNKISDDIVSTENIDIILHEFAHGICVETAGLKSVDDKTYNGAILEAYADVLGELAEAKCSGKEPDWTCGTDRNLVSPSDEYLMSYDEKFVIDEALDCYKLSTIISRTAYLMWNGIGGKNGAITDVGILSQLWYNSLFMLNGDSDFSHCRTAVETSAQRLFEHSILTKEQIDCISWAFDQTFVSESVLCDVVSINPALRIYSAEDVEYYNYHYTIEKMTGGSFSNNGVNSGVKCKVVDEGDVKTEKVVNLKALSEASVHNCVYKVTISDLSEKMGRTQTKYVTVAESDGVKGVLSFETNYISAD